MANNLSVRINTAADSPNWGTSFTNSTKWSIFRTLAEVHSALWRLVQKEFPDRRYPTLSYPDNVLEVWDHAKYEPKWDAFVAKHNVPGFADQFMEQTIDAEPTDEREPE